MEASGLLKIWSFFLTLLGSQADSHNIISVTVTHFSTARNTANRAGTALLGSQLRGGAHRLLLRLHIIGNIKGAEAGQSEVPVSTPSYISPWQMMRERADAPRKPAATPPWVCPTGCW